MSNFCTEICLPQDKDNIAVCNLASLNLAVHVHHKQVDWEKLEESVRYAIHQLDNLIDINVLAHPGSRTVRQRKSRDRHGSDGFFRHARTAWHGI